MRKSLLIFISALGFAVPSLAQTSLSAGDIAFLAIQSGATGQTNPDRFAFVLLKSIEAETKITFVDNSVLNPNPPAKYCRNEGFCDWTSTANLSIGTVVTISSDSVASSGIASGTINLSQSGDQIIAFQAAGSDSIPLAAISTTRFELTCNTECGGSGTDNNNKTCLPVGLVNGVNAISFSSELNNAQFNLEELSGSPSEILAQINNPANWARNDQLQTWDEDFWSFSITSVAQKFRTGLFSVQPNPAQNLIQIQTKGDQVGAFRLMDAQGKYLPITWNKNQWIDISMLEPGIYALQIQLESGAGYESIRFIKR